MSSGSGSSPVIFYAIPYCPFCYRVRFVLNHHQVNYEEKLVQPVGKTTAPAWFLALNPLGEVPVIVHNDKPVVDSITIAQYIDTQLPAATAPKIFPAQETEKAAHTEAVKKVSGLMMAMNGFVTAMGPAIPEAKEKFNAAIVHFFTNDFQGPYILGSSLTYADVILYQILIYSDILKTFKNWSFPENDDIAKSAAKKFSTFFNLVASSPAAQKIKFADQQKFLAINERRAVPGPISTFILTHNAFRNNLKALQSTSPATSHSAEFNNSLAQFLEQFNFHAAVEDSLLFPAIDAKEHAPTSQLIHTEQKDYHYQTPLLDVPKEGHKKLHELELHLKQSLAGQHTVAALLDQLKIYGETALSHLADEEKVMSPVVNKWTWEQQSVIVRHALYAADHHSKNGAALYVLYLLNSLNSAQERLQIVRNIKFALQHADTHETKDEEKLKDLLHQVKLHASAEIQQQIQALL